MGRLEGKVCVITGAGGGMGREAALLFAAEGARVCAADVDGEAAERTAAELPDGLAVRVDVADERSVEAMYRAAAARFGGLDVLYNNAGISPADDAGVLETELEAWQRVQDVNTTGVFLCCKHGIPYLLERGGGSVINVASFVALLGAATSQISYTASKGAVLALSRELAVQFAREGVRVNALCSSTSPWAASRRRARSSTARSSSRATSRRSSPARPSSSTAASPPPTSRPKAPRALRRGGRTRARRAP
jgi:NAD(P)-dependent dehydrogenase (short-subunit alcohol dehydrogenase family)